MNHEANIIKWQPLIGVSCLLHLTVFALMVFLPGFMSLNSRALPDTIYEVDLVALSGLNGSQPKNLSEKSKAIESLLNSGPSVKRIMENKSKEEEPIKIAKLSTVVKTPPEKSQEASSSELIKETITKIEKQAKVEKQVKQEEDRQIEEALTKFKGQLKVGPNTGGAQATAALPGTGTSITGGSAAMQIYQSEIKRWIYSKWSYPVALSNQKDLEAVVELSVKANGSIEKTTFVKRSNNPVFDASILKAVERANPLPPFPEGYHKSDEEIQITFSLKDV
jgi:colicin import membrane protein